MEKEKSQATGGSDTTTTTTTTITTTTVLGAHARVVSQGPVTITTTQKDITREPTSRFKRMLEPNFKIGPILQCTNSVNINIERKGNKELDELQKLIAEFNTKVVRPPLWRTLEHKMIVADLREMLADIDQDLLQREQFPSRMIKRIKYHRKGDLLSDGSVALHARAILPCSFYSEVEAQFHKPEFYKENLMLYNYKGLYEQEFCDIKDLMVTIACRWDSIRPSIKEAIIYWGVQHPQMRMEFEEQKNYRKYEKMPGEDDMVLPLKDANQEEYYKMSTLFYRRNTPRRAASLSEFKSYHAQMHWLMLKLMLDLDERIPRFYDSEIKESWKKEAIYLAKQRAIPLRLKRIPPFVYGDSTILCPNNVQNSRYKHQKFQPGTRCYSCPACVFEEETRRCRQCTSSPGFGEHPLYQIWRIEQVANGLMEAHPQDDFVCFECMEPIRIVLRRNVLFQDESRFGSNLWNVILEAELEE
ncbi:uncharacterized protein LOC114576046 [Exaiptasia diaphana]|uniref:Uncharacterized protein n=1 Tax=Exaiptasia diaphana TaxID=2652724 RepID=A0A913YS16_EXADI|nr:uncharacterized protein LOC114576046 [Exaiptasia diaphana]